MKTERREALRNIGGMPQLKDLFFILDQLVINMEKDVLNFDLNASSFANLALVKAKCDGAKSLVNKLKHEINNIKGNNDA